MNNQTRKWTIVVDRETDISLRTHLAQRGMKKGDLSKFVEEAVKWQLFDDAVTDIRKGFADMPAEEVEALVEEAVTWARSPEGRAANLGDDNGV